MPYGNIVNAFEFGTVVENIKLPKSKSSEILIIKCIEYLKGRIYIGTNSGNILLYQLDDGSFTFPTLINYIQHNQKKPIETIILSDSLGILVALCHGRLYLFSMNDTLEFSKNQYLSSFRGVTTIAKNKYPQHDNPFTTEVIIGTKYKNLYLVELCDTSHNVVYETNLSEIPLIVTGVKYIVLVASEFSYTLVDMKNNRKESLFTYNIYEFSPCIQSFNENEFFITGPTAEMAMHINLKGIAIREPIISKTTILNIVESFPYSLILSVDNIIIQQMFTNEIVQKFILYESSKIKNINGHIFVYSGHNLRYIRPIPFENQILSLLAENEINRSFHLIDIVEKHQEKYSITNKNNLLELKLSIVYIKLHSFLFNDAKDIFIENSLNIPPFLYYYDDSIKFEHSFPQIDQYYLELVNLMKCDTQSQQFFDEFIIDLLESCRNMQPYYNNLTNIDTLLVKLYAKVNHKNFINFLDEPNRCKYNEIVQYLNDSKKYYGLSLFYIQRGKQQLACEIWIKLLNEEIIDSDFNDYNRIIFSIKFLNDNQLFWSIMTKLFEKDPLNSINVFNDITWNSLSNESNHTADVRMIDIPINEIISFLSQYPYNIQIPFYEHIIYHMKNNEEIYHTKLAYFYIIDIKIHSNDCEVNDEIFHINRREKLKKFLEYSQYYNPSSVLTQLADMPLHEERIILLSVLGHHIEALNILINVMHDYEQAERYCISTPKKSLKPITSKQLYQILFSIIMSNSKNNTKPLFEKNNIINFINNHFNCLDPITTLKHIPNNYVLSDINNYMHVTCKKLDFDYFQRVLHSGMSDITLTKYLSRLKSTSNTKILLCNENVCHVCHRKITDPNIIVSNNGFITHLSCSNSHKTPNYS